MDVVGKGRNRCLHRSSAGLGSAILPLAYLVAAVVFTNIGVPGMSRMPGEKTAFARLLKDSCSDTDPATGRSEAFTDARLMLVQRWRCRCQDEDPR